MRIIFLKIAALLFGFGISLKCNAADENSPNPNGSSTLPSPAPLPVQAINGMPKFQELFHLTDNNKITYKVTVDYAPQPALGDALKKHYASLKDTSGLNRIPSLEAYADRISKGSQTTSTYTLYVSKTAKLMVERVETDQWIKGYVTQTYFTGENITEIEPSAGIATIFPCDVSRYLGLLNNFPVLYDALGYVPDKLQIIMGSAPIFTVLNKNMPFQFLLKLDSSQSLAETDEIVSGNKKRRVTKFEYSAQSPLWPSSIKADNLGSNGTLEAHEQWDLLKIENLPVGFDFTPKIEQRYRVVDKTPSKIPSEEIRNLINQ
jgi:hypothetical protein